MALMGSKPAPSERKINHGPEERVKMTRLRLTIAKRLKEAQENAAMLTTFNEVDMSEVIAMRSQYKDEFQKNYGVKLGFMSFFVKACVIGLKNYPAINAEIQNEDIVYKNYYRRFTRWYFHNYKRGYIWINVIYTNFKSTPIRCSWYAQYYSKANRCRWQRRS